MRPIETAKALGSPFLVSDDGNATGREIARGLNRKQLRYGGVSRDEIAMTGVASDVHREDDHRTAVRDERKDENRRLRLLMKSPEIVLAPSKGWVFGG